MTRLFIMLVAIAVLGGLALFLRFTRAGLLVRAVNQDRATASAMGVNARLIDAFIFGLGAGVAGIGGVVLAMLGPVTPNRSEEHTSELQSLMRISYAVFCLKKKYLKYINMQPLYTFNIYYLYQLTYMYTVQTLL